MKRSRPHSGREPRREEPGQAAADPRGTSDEGAGDSGDSAYIAALEVSFQSKRVERSENYCFSGAPALCSAYGRAFLRTAREVIHHCRERDCGECPAQSHQTDLQLTFVCSLRLRLAMRPEALVTLADHSVITPTNHPAGWCTDCNGEKRFGFQQGSLPADSFDHRGLLRNWRRMCAALPPHRLEGIRGGPPRFAAGSSQ